MMALLRWLGVSCMCVLVTIAPTAQAPDTPDLEVYARIRDEGQARSRVMRYATELVDGIGARLTGSPNLAEAVGWAQQRLREIGLERVQAEDWGEFGLGWEPRQVWARMVAPDYAPLVVHAAPWSGATPGPITGDVMAVGGLPDERAFERVRGRLRGRIVLLGRATGAPEVLPFDKPLFHRFTERDLESASTRTPEPEANPDDIEAAFARLAHGERIGRFLEAEGVAAVLVPSGNRPRGGISGGTLVVDGNTTFGYFGYLPERRIDVPVLVVAVEHYGRIERLLARDVPVRLEVNVETAITGERERGVNVLADLPGTDPTRRDELVLVGAHLDSWAAGTGATDDGAGVVIGMEAMRILKAVGVRPRRTIRLALWTGEEQGALGSLGYVNRHVATIPRATTAAALQVMEFLRRRSGPVVPKAEHTRISAVFTLDAGGGRIRGVSVGSRALVPLFQSWIAPLRDLGVTMVSPNSDCGGDCTPFADAGLPTPVFTHDPLDYETRTHHTNMDVYEYLHEDDLRQAAVVLASVVYSVAARDGMLPRQP